ncbi:unnamed protein product [Didymodactylos carnosus]|uniref:Uncharacterized protein n=1 Tax=Didymodactylos carnosus TaxID=1234261 RepID=A0A815XNL6_9BILA|nr:unnamed protein product [Didymodactylos carnosus]CAF1559818.1 unnamed protein product [Didymodactylos carnosus]CAF3759758.1 unnamed protein product [Didymodactylos carnosus]CAF4421198.1 unnamed protein product [Didymodactylos carnosus]
MTLHQFCNDSQKDNDATCTKICEWFDVDTSEENQKIISDRIYHYTVRKKSDMESWRRCNIQRREKNYSTIVLNKSSLRQRSKPPKHVLKGFLDLEYRQKRRRLATLNEVLDDFSNSNNTPINQLLGYSLYQRNYNDDKHLAKVGEELYNTNIIETKTSLNLDQTIALKYNLNLTTHDADFMKPFLHEHVYIPNRNRIREISK